jgi:hypothetical protein
VHEENRIASIITGTCTGKSGVWIAARILGNLGIPAVQADLASITYTVQDLTTQKQIGTGTLTVANVMYNSLVQSDARWTVDSQWAPNASDRQWGYNFAATIPAADFAGLWVIDYANRVTPDTVQITVTFVPVVGEQFQQVWQPRLIPTY